MPPKSSRAEMKGQTSKPTAEAKPEKSQAELRDALERRLHTLKPRLDDVFAEYASALKDDTFEDKEGEPEGSGEKRKENSQNKIRILVERAEGIRRQLDSGEPLTETLDLDATAIDAYLSTVSWIVPEGRTPKVAFTPPSDLDFNALSQDTDTAKVGEYTLSPETQVLDFETLRAFVPDLSAFNGKPLHEVMQHVVDTYGSQYHIPGIEYWKWLCENPGKNPPGMAIKDGKYYFLPGSVLRDEDGGWDVPYAGWDGSEWSRRAGWLTDGWNSHCRVVLLEK